MRNLK